MSERLGRPLGDRNKEEVVCTAHEKPVMKPTNVNEVVKSVLK
jgi:hypothetical protein